MEILEVWKKQTITAKDLATIFKIGKNSSYNFINKNEFHTVKINSTIRISMKSFKEYLNKQAFPINDCEVFENQVYTMGEIQDILNISKNPAYTLLKENHFQFIKVGKSIRVSKVSFDQWLNTT